MIIQLCKCFHCGTGWDMRTFTPLETTIISFISPSFSFAKPTTLCAYFPFVTLYCKASGQLAASVLRGLTMFQLNVKIFPFSSYMLNELLLNLLLNWVMYSHHISCYKPPMGLLKANPLCVGSYCSPGILPFSKHLSFPIIFRLSINYLFTNHFYKALNLWKSFLSLAI